MQKIKVGKAVATFGLEGQIIVTHSLGKKTTFKSIKALFIEQVKNTYVPYFVINNKVKSEEETILSLEGISSKESAKLLVGKNVWLEEADFEKLVAKQTAIGLLNFILFDEDTEIGKVIEVIEQPHQILLTVSINEKEAYIPMHQDNTLKVDYKKKQIVLSLPDGLLDIYH
jgi:16S rRNA processing protein RimM